MKLRTIIIINLTLMFLVYAAIIFFIPAYIVHQDVGTVYGKLKKEITERSERIINAQSFLLAGLFENFQENVHSALFSIYSKPSVQQKFYSTHPWSPWEEMLQTLAYDSDLELMQIDLIGGGQHAVLMPAEANLYDVQAVPGEDKNLIVTREGGEKWIGIAFSSSHLKKAYYVLVNSDLTKEELERRTKQIQAVAKNMKESPQVELLQMFASTHSEDLATARWIEKHQILRVLVSLIGDSNQEEIIGVARIDSSMQGSMVYTDEAISFNPVLQAADYYNSELPPPDKPTLAKEDKIISAPSMKHIYLVNTLKMEQFYATIGIPLDPLVQQVGQWSEADTIMRVSDDIWFGFHPNGSRFTENEIHEFKQQVIEQLGSDPLIQLEQTMSQPGAQPLRKVIYVEGQPYFYSELNLQDDLSFSLLSKLGGVGSVQSIALSSAKELATRISLQLFILFSIMGVLLVCTIFTRATVITVRPVSALSKAADKIGEGKYTEVVLPPMGKRKDEIAQLVGAFGRMVEGLKEKEQIRSVLDKVVSKDIATEILKSKIHLGGEDREVSVLFADIRGFTAMTQNMTPQQTIQMLNTCMTKVTGVIEGEGGVVDKYVGDAVMAIYGAPTANPKHAINAVSTGVLMLKAIRGWNQERISQGEKPIQIGIGVHTGMAVAGNMGAENRLNYTVLGANVNLAARLCEAAAPDQLLISEETLNAPGVKEGFIYESVEAKDLKGFDRPVIVYQIVDFNWQKSE